MVWEVIFCTGARVGDDSGYSIPDRRRAAVRELAGRTVLPKLVRRRVFVDVRLILQTLSRLHRTRRNSPRYSFFASQRGVLAFCARSTTKTCWLCFQDNAELAAHLSATAYTPVKAV